MTKRGRKEIKEHKAKKANGGEAASTNNARLSQ